MGKAEDKPTAAKSIGEVVAHGQTPRQKSFYNYGRVSPSVAQSLLAVHNLDLTGYQHRIEADAVRKVLADHGRDPLPMLPEDFCNLPAIVDEPDTVRLSGDKTKR